MTANVRLIAVGRSEAGQPFTVISDPAFVRWQAEGAPTCGATWEEEPCSYCEECGAEIAGEVNVGEDGLFYCDDCWANCDDDGDDSGELWDFADAVSWF